MNIPVLPQEFSVPVAESPRETLRNNIRLRRMSLGLSQRQLARLVGISQPCIFLYEKGSTAPTIDHLIALAKALETSPHLFLVPDAFA